MLERELGRGGMATVYLAQDLRHQRSVALKVLHPALAQALGPERFLREIQIAARLQHAHILPLFDSGTADGLPYYAMPYIEGESLRARMTRERQLDLPEALRISREIAAALGHAHAQGIVHRDIKPENILLTREGSVRVADFGIARAAAAAGVEKLTETGLSLGTPAYMSPEQAAGDDQLDGRSDLYALGCVLYEMLAGQPPFTGAHRPGDPGPARHRSGAQPAHGALDRPPGPGPRHQHRPGQGAGRPLRHRGRIRQRTGPSSECDGAFASRRSDTRRHCFWV